MSFTDEELAYLRSQPLARVATLGADGQPDVVPLAFEYDGWNMAGEPVGDTWYESRRAVHC
ncbi:pyridoxamine 5'-phosphate oxidase family protein [Nonomuraea sp. M3C6]|uniref:Pyridoxamine 5'-phosphate oxidase family protein n=1 Tax=Nonomuraea marmarensis TaxID=3351344 RepID=A0ABW7AJE5_9ACTN